MALSAKIEAAKQAFAKANGLAPSDPKTLEAFFTDCVLRHRNMSPFQAKQSWRSENKILIGGTQDTQLDAIVVFLNGVPLRPKDSLDTLEQLASDDAPIDVSFIFVQATGAVLEKGPLSQKVATFGSGVFSFLAPSKSPRRGVNKALQEWIDLKDKIFEILDAESVEACRRAASLNVKGSPLCVATMSSSLCVGSWVNPSFAREPPCALARVHGPTCTTQIRPLVVTWLCRCRDDALRRSSIAPRPTWCDLASSLRPPAAGRRRPACG